MASQTDDLHVTSIGETVANRYKTLKLLGKGSFGRVFKVRDVKVSGGNDEIKALKEVDMSAEDIDDATRSGTLSEARLMRDLSHPNVVKYFDSFYDNANFYICTEYCEGGDLNVVIQAHKTSGTRIPEAQIWMWVIQIVLGVKYIHKNRILHRDIKTRNIFLRNNLVKIGDFGISRVLADTRSDLARTNVGTPYYMSPEAISYDGYNHKADIWSIGCVIYELVALRAAFEGRNIYQVFNRIINADLPPWPEEYSEHLRDLFWKMMQKDPDKRPSAGELQRLPSICEHSKEVEADLNGWLTQAEPVLTSESEKGEPTKAKGTSSMGDTAAKEVKNFWARMKQDGAASGSSAKAAKKDTAKIKVGMFVAVIDSGTASDIKDILQQFKGMMSNKEESPVETRNYGSREDPFTDIARRTKLRAYQSEAHEMLDSATYNQVYTYLKSARSPSSTVSDTDISRQMKTIGTMDSDAQTIMEHIVFLEKQQELAKKWAK